MNHVNRLQILYGWTPNYRQVFKKPVLPGLKKVPQFIAQQGWIFLVYDEQIPKAYWIGKDIQELCICLDERLFGDTILRAEKISGHEHKYVISDIFIYASTNIHRLTTFEERFNWTSKILKKFHKHIPGLAELYSKETSFPIKGYEYYDNKKGSSGIYSDAKEIVYKSDIPDVYFVRGKPGYVAVPDLKTSEFLRSKGSEFELDIEEKEGKWYIKSFA
jgi:hypothetical protein